MLFHERLKGIREKRGFKQNYIAERIGVDKSTMSGYENGKREPSLEIISKLAEIYEVTTDYLLGTSSDGKLTQEQDKQLDEEAERILHMLEQIDPEERLVLENMMRAYVETKLATKKKEQ